jgi:hypothetical protein
MIRWEAENTGPIAGLLAAEIHLPVLEQDIRTTLRTPRAFSCAGPPMSAHRPRPHQPDGSIQDKVGALHTPWRRSADIASI